MFSKLSSMSSTNLSFISLESGDTAAQAKSTGAGFGALGTRSAPMSIVRDAARRVIYRIGALSLYHRVRNRRTLTVVAFHRILRRGDPRWETALPPWTLFEDTFDDCLEFFKRHYKVVTLDDVKASIKATRPLPSRSLLVTFDDGFADNLNYALPLLRKHGLSATIFISSNVVGCEERLWTEDLLWAFTTGQIGQRELCGLNTLLFGDKAGGPDDPNLIWNIVRRGPELDQAQVHAALSKLQIDLHRIVLQRQMLTHDEIAELAANAISIGAHGKTHTALPFASDVAAELSSPRAALADIVAAHGQHSIDALSFPHGAYTPNIVEQALAAGYTLLFTSETELSVLKNGFLSNPIIGRLDVDDRRIAPAGKFRPDILATSLFTAARRARPAPHHALRDHDRRIGLREVPIAPQTGDQDVGGQPVCYRSGAESIDATT